MDKIQILHQLKAEYLMAKANYQTSSKFEYRNS